MVLYKKKRDIQALLLATVSTFAFALVMSIPGSAFSFGFAFVLAVSMFGLSAHLFSTLLFVSGMFMPVLRSSVLLLFGHLSASGVFMTMLGLLTILFVLFMSSMFMLLPRLLALPFVSDILVPEPKLSPLPFAIWFFLQIPTFILERQKLG